MLYADPPYGMDLQADYTKMGHGGGRAHRQVIGDDKPFDPSPIMALTRSIPEQFWWGADYYREHLPEGGSWVVWDKRSTEMDLDSLFGAAFELCWSRRAHQRLIARFLWAMTHGTNAATEDTGRGLHPTQKPVGLARWFFEQWGKPGDVIFDPFGGSGSTLIAAEDSERIARLVEIDPPYVDVIVERYEAHTGITPMRERVAA